MDYPKLAGSRPLQFFMFDHCDIIRGGSPWRLQEALMSVACIPEIPEDASLTGADLLVDEVDPEKAVVFKREWIRDKYRTDPDMLYVHCDAVVLSYNMKPVAHISGNLNHLDSCGIGVIGMRALKLIQGMRFICLTSERPWV